MFGGGNSNNSEEEFEEYHQEENNSNMFSKHSNKFKKGKNIFSNIGKIIKKEETPIDECDYKLDLSKVIKNFPVKAICQPLRIEFENGYNSKCKSVFYCTQNIRKGTIKFMVRLEIKSIADLAKNKSRIVDSLNNPDMVYYQIGNADKDDYMRDLDPSRSVSCEKIKIAFGMFN